MPFVMALDGLLWSKVRGKTALGMVKVEIDITGFRLSYVLLNSDLLNLQISALVAISLKH